MSIRKIIAVSSIVALGILPFAVFADDAADQQKLDELLRQVSEMQAQLDALIAISKESASSSATVGTTTTFEQNPFVSKPAATLNKAKGRFVVDGEVAATSRLNVRDTPKLKGLLISKVDMGTRGVVLWGPVYADGYIWWQVKYLNNTLGWSAENWLTKSELYGIKPGTLRIRATIDGKAWNGSLVTGFSYPEFSADAYNISTRNYPNLPPGEYVFQYKSGGPKNALFGDITPSNTQMLTSSSTITFTFNFLSSTTASTTR